MNRTSDTTFRKRVLYPLSYGATVKFIIAQSMRRAKTKFYLGSVANEPYSDCQKHCYAIW